MTRISDREAIGNSAKGSGSRVVTGSAEVEATRQTHSAVVYSGKLRSTLKSHEHE